MVSTGSIGLPTGFSWHSSPAKKRDGYFHFGYFERKRFKPKKKNHFDGTVYILTGGNTFSASTLFTQAVKHQKNVVVTGEETGGGAYGNNAWLIPDITLPNIPDIRVFNVCMPD